MEEKEIIKELSMNYIELCNYLIEKHGVAKYSYFHTKEMKSKNKKIGRSKEGLYCHHIDEDKADNLSNPEFARNYPFDFQMPNRLVYCNILEHLILHIKICLIRNRIMPAISTFITGEINDYYNGYISSKPNSNILYMPLENNKSNYIKIIKYLASHMKISKQEKKDIARGICTDINKDVLNGLIEKK